MPVMNGWQFHRETQADAAIATIPVVVLSAWRDGDAPVPVDASRFLPKPVEVKEVLAFAARYCQ
jgi:CheY-like chemotaxis protein